MAAVMTSPIKIAYPAVEGELALRIEAGACRLRITPGEDDSWISGTYQDPSGSIALETTVEGKGAWIRVGRSPADVFGFLSGLPELDLRLGKARPFAMTIAAGASENHLEFGGLPLTGLEVNHGAGAMEIRCSTPLPGRTARMKFAVGAGRTELSGLGNVNFDELLVEGGAASYVLDFSGRGLQSGWARLSTAMASVELRIPATLACEITTENLLGAPAADAGFSRHGNTWLSKAAAAGAPVQLRIRSAMVMGRLSLSTID